MFMSTIFVILTPREIKDTDISSVSYFKRVKHVVD